MSNDSTLPSAFSFKTTNQLSTVNITLEKISTIIKTLDQNKVYHYNESFIGMIIICVSSIITPLQLLFNICVQQGDFPNIWKKNSKQLKQ